MRRTTVLLICLCAMGMIELYAAEASAIKCLPATLAQQVKEARAVYVAEVIQIQTTRDGTNRRQIRVLKVLKDDPRAPLSRRPFWLENRLGGNIFPGKPGEIYLFFGTEWFCHFPIRLR